MELDVDVIADSNAVVSAADVDAAKRLNSGDGQFAFDLDGRLLSAPNLLQGGLKSQVDDCTPPRFGSVDVAAVLGDVFS